VVVERCIRCGFDVEGASRVPSLQPMLYVRVADKDPFVAD
jgi:hypothetical protein